jgi:hypothetical protein
MASHEIRVRMRQKDVSQFEPVFGKISQVPVYIPFWIDYDSFTSRCDNVRRVRESRNKEPLNVQGTSLGLDAGRSKPYLPGLRGVRIR